MRTLLSPAIVLFCAAPSLGQGLPALEGQGSQTQTVELANDALSLSIDSGGSLSLGRGDDHVAVDLGVTLNDNPIQLGGRPDTPADAPSPTGTPEAATAVKVAGPFASQGARSSSLPCTTVAEDALDRALAGGFSIVVQQAVCDPQQDQRHVWDESSPFRAAISDAGIDFEDVVAITINDAAVIVGVSHRR
ncbi:hypothetical protein SAMN06295905_2050 [Devosia lucknowensis]|uniref:Uncharacterized protein n=1 Tax=Devosia lucknowensis TaxID=1096929 RepID=A0A1Y6FBS9_9HYPH|nr:hypothetical protein [Devosia lucknowensis]SMQ72139.1 hypothetical protein SAMN06295905_2050 [Devosia lucknowensis]